MTTMQRWLAAAVLALGLGAANPAMAAEPTAVQAKAQESVKDNAAKVTRLAYVSARSHTKVDYVKGTVYKDDSFSLTYKFSYRDSDNDPQTYTLRFDFDKAGSMTDLKIVNHSSFWPPFNAAVIADGVLKELSK